MRDPRRLRAIKALSEVGSVFLVLSPKGGVGKTTVSTLLALASASLGFKVGLLDVDFVNPSTHILLGLSPGEIKYVEERGVKPFNLRENLYYFTIVSYTLDRPLPLRGASASNALWEVLAIVNWGSLNAIFVDTPPGLGDEHLDMLTWLKGLVKPLLVSTPSALAKRSIERLVEVLRELGYRELYLVENMGEGSLVSLAESLGLSYVGYIPYEPGIEELVKTPDKLTKTRAWSQAVEASKKILSQQGELAR
ncbi:MAG: P-loop NTPase [Desulfurococcaceae archaeon]|nr:P-loop NTPase [Desulfurococcaceae archaeon]